MYFASTKGQTNANNRTTVDISGPRVTNITTVDISALRVTLSMAEMWSVSDPASQLSVGHGASCSATGDCIPASGVIKCRLRLLTFLSHPPIRPSDILSLPLFRTSDILSLPLFRTSDL